MKEKYDLVRIWPSETIPTIEHGTDWDIRIEPIYLGSKKDLRPFEVKRPSAWYLGLGHALPVWPSP